MSRTKRINFPASRTAVRRLATAVVSVIALAAGTAAAQSGAIGGEGTTRAEMALLPPYCPHAPLYTKIFGSQEGFAAWEARLGPDFKKIHHYCWALVAIQRANRGSSSPQERKAYLNAAERDIGFVIRGADPGFVLMPEMYLRRGQVRVRSNKEREAVEDFERAIALRPDYSPPYVEIAELLKRQDRLADARRVLERGLEHAPDSKYLRNALAELGPAPAGARKAEPVRERTAEPAEPGTEKQAASPKLEQDTSTTP